MKPRQLARKVRILIVGLGLSLLGGTAGFAYTECYPCTQCQGRYCFIYSPTGELIGTIGNTCCTNGQV